MDKLKAILALFRQGNEVANPGAWKNATIIANLLLAVAGVAAAFGFKVELDADNAAAIAAGAVALVSVVNGIVHAVTSKKAGLPAEVASPQPVSQG
jgi:uncharacterized membrane protein